MPEVARVSDIVERTVKMIFVKQVVLFPCDPVNSLGIYPVGDNDDLFLPVTCCGGEEVSPQ